MINYLVEYKLEYKYEAGDVVGKAPKIYNFCSLVKIQGMMVEVVELKSHNAVFSLFLPPNIDEKPLKYFFIHASLWTHVRIIKFLCQVYLFVYITFRTYLCYELSFKYCFDLVVGRNINSQI